MQKPFIFQILTLIKERFQKRKLKARTRRILRCTKDSSDFYDTFVNIPASSLKQKTSFVSINVAFSCFAIHIQIVKLILQIILQYRLHTKCIQFPIIQRQSSITLYKLFKLLFYICIRPNMCMKYINFPFGFQWNINPPYYVMDITVLQKKHSSRRGVMRTKQHV